MATYLYPVFLIALLAVPLAANWRWGFGASLATTLVALLLILAGFALFVALGFFPGEARSGPITPVRAMQLQTSAAVVDIVAGIVIPALATLIGAGLSAIWTVAAVLRDRILQIR